MLGSHRGFTLIETMLALILLSMIVGVATPAVRKMVHGQQLRRASTDLGMALLLTRHEAIMRKRPVVLDNQDGDWSTGWQIFVDQNGNGALDSEEPLLGRGEAVAKGVRISGNTPVSRYVRYMPTGEAKLQSGAFQAGTITLCHSDGQQAVRKLVLSATGRLRTVREAAGSC